MELGGEKILVDKGAADATEIDARIGNDCVEPEYRAELEETIQHTGFQMIEAMDKAGKSAEAASGYLAFAREFPSSPLVETAYYDAAVAYVKAEKVDEAIKVREDFIKRFPGSPHTPEMIGFLGDNYRKTISFDKAADWYEKLATGYPNYKTSPDYLYNAALFRENLGETKRAIDDYRQYLKAYPSDTKITCEILFTIADIYETKVKSKPEATRAFEEYLRTFPATFDIKTVPPGRDAVDYFLFDEKKGYFDQVGLE